MKIEVNNLSFSYKKKSAPVLDGASVVLEEGNIYALLGPNGSGKTTFANLILGLLKPSGGSITIDGKDAGKISAAQRAKSIGYLFQNPDMQLFAPTVMEELTFPFEIEGALTNEKKEALKKTLKDFGLEGMEERFPLTMSGGEKQRLALATVMSRSVKFLILDEPTSAIDMGGREFISDFVNGFAGGALIITHDKEFLESLKNPKILTLKGGKIYEA